MMIFDEFSREFPFYTPMFAGEGLNLAIIP